MREIVKIVTVISLSCICSLLSADSFRITKMKPDQKIDINGRLCGLGDIFSDNEVVNWDPSLSVQAIQAISIEHPNTRIEMSKNIVLEVAKQNVSYKTYIGLVSKGSSKDIITIWEGDTISIKLPFDSEYQYRLRIRDTRKTIELQETDSIVFIPWDAFVGVTGLIDCYIDRKKKNDRTVIDVVQELRVELIQ